MLMGFLLCALLVLVGFEIPANVVSAPVADKATLEAIARSYLQGNVATVGVDNRIPQIQLSKIEEAGSFYVTRFEQTYNGLPVYNTTALVMISKDGLRPVDAVSQFKTLSAVINTKIDAQAALKIATGAIAEKVIPRGSPKTEEMLCTFEAPGVQLSTGEGKIVSHVATSSSQAARVCWQVNVPALDPLGTWSILVDGPTGKVISKQNLIMYDTGEGWVYRYGNPIQTGGNQLWDPPDDLDHNFLTIQETNGLPPNNFPPVDLLNLNSGTGTLSGSYVDLTAPGIVGGYKPAGLADEPTREYYYTRADDRFEEVMVYYYVDSVHRYLQQMGEGGLLNYPVPAHAHYGAFANAFYDPSNGGLHFGDGYGTGYPDLPFDFAEDADVIIHEYGHAIHGDQGLFNGYVSEEMGAFSEGFSDYLSASFLDQGATGTDGCLAEWFGYELYYTPSDPYGSYPYCMRNTFSTKHYPEDKTYEVHDDGEMWSAALWRLRGMLGKDVVDRLAVLTGYFVWSSASFRDAVNGMVQVDRVVYGGVHESTIRQVFRENGMLAYWIWTDSYPWQPWSDSINHPLVDNNGFEAGVFAPVWSVEASDPSVTPQIVTSPVYAGTYAAELVGSSGGSVTESAIYYEFTMPSDATWVSLRFHYRIDTIDWYPWDSFEWRLGTDYSYWYWSDLLDTGGQFYQYRADVPVAGLGMVGQACRLTFLLHDDGASGDPTYVYLDGNGGANRQDDISLRSSNFHAPVTINGETRDTPWEFGKRILDGTPVSISAPSQVDIGGPPYHFMQWSDGELDSTHPSFMPTQDTYLEADYHQGWTVPFTSYYLKSSVTLDGQITSTTEWSDAVPQNLTLPEWGNGAAAVSAKCWMKNDLNWLYILERVTWSGPTSAKSDSDISYYWDWWNGVWPHSDMGGVNFDGTTFDMYGWDETTWYNDPVNNVQGKATYDGTYYWFEFKKPLNSGDGYDWTFVPGETYGPNPPSLMVGFYDESAGTWYGTNILLTLSSLSLSLGISFANYPNMFIVDGAATATVAIAASNPHSPCGAAHTIDVVGGNLIVSSLIPYSTGTNLDAIMDVQAAHAVGSTIVLDVAGNIISTGGPGVNYVWKYYNDAGILPAYFQSGGVYVPSTTQHFYMTNMYGGGQPVTDYAIIELYNDGGRNVLLVAGLSGYATYYASKWLEQATVDGTIRNYNAQAIILKLYLAGGGDPLVTPPTITVQEQV